MGLFIKNKRHVRKIINHHTVEGTRESHPRVHDLQHPRLGKPRRGLQILDTRMGFPCPFHSVVIDSISLNIRTIASPKVGQDRVYGGVSVLCWHAAPIANVLWKPLKIR